MAALGIKTFILLYLLFNIPLLSSGMVDGFKINSIHSDQQSLHKDMSMRKRLMLGAVLDYDDTGPNPKHDPRKKPGPGGKP
ncbi:hypothetical protein WN944_014736 [Citrus x changshan-huyou]|uniref:Uncharacterized protein n=3 Tax=Citrus TaxID=2706 RepID=V4TLU8_CITCL|nr:hypothetical protein CICLE_v10023135mg [Citrus x clementina]GAY31831.1 hypothetical protein CUMW_280670 [Citrus unshiu]